MTCRTDVGESQGSSPLNTQYNNDHFSKSPSRNALSLVYLHVDLVESLAHLFNFFVSKSCFVCQIGSCVTYLRNFCAFFLCQACIILLLLTFRIASDLGCLL